MVRLAKNVAALLFLAIVLWVGLITVLAINGS